METTNDFYESMHDLLFLVQGTLSIDGDIQLAFSVMNDHITRTTPAQYSYFLDFTDCRLHYPAMPPAARLKAAQKLLTAPYAPIFDNGSHALLAAREYQLSGLQCPCFIPAVYQDVLYGCILCDGKSPEWTPAHMAALQPLGDIWALALHNRCAMALQRQQAADQTRRTKSDFLSRMSHEIRTPINAIMGLSSIATDRLAPDDVQEKMAQIHASSVQLLHIVNDVLDMSSLASQKMKLCPGAFELKELVDSLLETFAPLAAQKQQSLDANISSCLPRTYCGDRTRLSQVLAHLLDNALKFTPVKGRIFLQVCQSAQDGDTITLEFAVTDTGIGISQENQKRLFHFFEQGDGSSTRRFEGTGLGLALCKSLVELMGGDISVISTEGKGSTFMFTIKLQAAAEDRALLEPKAKSPGPSVPDLPRHITFPGTHILLAGTGSPAYQLVRQFLSNASIKLDLASDGKEAVDIFMHYPDKYDLILMEISLPTMDGLAATRAIRSMKIQKAQKVPIFLIEETENATNAENSIASGANKYLTKLDSLDKLLSSLVSHLPQYSLPLSSSRSEVAAKRYTGVSGLASSRYISPKDALPRFNHNQNVYNALLKSFTKSSFCRQLQTELEAGETVSAEKTAKALMGLAENLALSEVQRAAALLIAHLRAGTDSHDSFEELNEIMAATVKAIGQYLQTYC